MVHGLTIPLGKLGFYLPRTLSQAFDSTTSDDPQPFRVRDRAEGSSGMLRERRRRTQTSGQSTPVTVNEREMYRIGGTVIRDRNSGTITPVEDAEVSQSHLPRRTIRFPDEAHASRASSN